MTKLIDQLKFEEGLRLDAYYCPAGKKTIGYGHNIDANPYYHGSAIPDRITKQEAEAILLHDIIDVEEELGSAWPAYHKITSHARQDALVNMAFQMGVEGLMKFKRTLGHVERQQWQQAYDCAMLSKWATQCPNRAIRVAGQLLKGVPYDVPVNS